MTALSDENAALRTELEVVKRRLDRALAEGEEQEAQVSLAAAATGASVAMANTSGRAAAAAAFHAERRHDVAPAYGPEGATGTGAAAASLSSSLTSATPHHAASGSPLLSSSHSPTMSFAKTRALAAPPSFALATVTQVWQLPCFYCFVYQGTRILSV